MEQGGGNALQWIAGEGESEVMLDEALRHYFGGSCGLGFFTPTKIIACDRRVRAEHVIRRYVDPPSEAEKMRRCTYPTSGKAWGGATRLLTVTIETKREKRRVVKRWV